MRSVRLCLLSLTVAAVACATDLPATITSNLTLTAADSPYYLRSTVTIPVGVTVTIEPGVRIIAAGDYLLIVEGTLTGTGRRTDPILFRAEDETARGAWGGIEVTETGALTLYYAAISNGLYNLRCAGRLTMGDVTLRRAAADGLLFWGPATLTLINCTFTDNAGCGLVGDGYEAGGKIQYCTFTANGSYPVLMKATLIEMLRGTHTFGGNGLERLGVSCSMVEDITDQDVWLTFPIPLELGAGGGDPILTLTAGAYLTIKAGNIIYGAEVRCSGGLTVAGSASKYTTFCSGRPTPAPGDWPGLTCLPGSSVTLQYTHVRHAQTGLTGDRASGSLTGAVIEDCEYDGVRLTGGGTLNITASSFNRNGRNGVRIEYSGCKGVISDCRFTANGSYPVWLLSRVAHLLSGNNTFVGNGRQMIGVHCDLGVSGDRVWATQSLPLDCTVSGTAVGLTIPAGSSLTLRPGLTLYLDALVNWGTLIVEGGSTRPCRFLPPPGRAAPGAWAGVRYGAGSAGSLDGAIISYGATGLRLNASPRVRECLVEYSLNDGLSCQNGAEPIVTASRFVNNGRHGVQISGTGRPNLGDLSNATTADDGRNVLRDNAGYDLYNNSAQTIYAQNNYWLSDVPSEVATRIYDRADAATKGPVYYQPLGRGNTAAPALRWVGSANFESDGTNPDLLAPGNQVTFKVTYSDADGLPPTEVALHLARGEQELPGSPFLMATSGSPNYVSGAVFQVQLRLDVPARDYRYWFTASDGEFAATGPPCAPHDGPLVNYLPTLTFAGAPDYADDGVRPDSGPPGTTFAYRVRYKDLDNDPPVSIVVHIMASGTPITGSPFALTGLGEETYATGRLYERLVPLKNAGNYTYRFEATDGLWPATGAATATLTGPAVSAPGLAMWALSAQQVGDGAVSVQWQLSAPAGVDAEVRNLAGRVVAVVTRGQPFGPGQCTLAWNRRLATGARTPPGQYLLMLTAHSADGLRRQMVLPLRLY